MGTWSDARTRFADLDAQAAQGLGRSNITVKKYTRPTGFMAVVFLAVLLTYVFFSKRSNFQSGSIIYDVLLRHVARFARFCYTVQPLVLSLTLAIHLTEATYMARSRLKKHTVPTFSKLWWIWIGSTFIEGAGAFIRIDRIVEDERARKASAKH
ncbi:MAG: hypothetical protein Q9193_005436 [Seirophora villosa]